MLKRTFVFLAALGIFLGVLTPLQQASASSYGWAPFVFANPVDAQNSRIAWTVPETVQPTIDHFSLGWTTGWSGDGTDVASSSNSQNVAVIDWPAYSKPSLFTVLPVYKNNSAGDWGGYAPGSSSFRHAPTVVRSEQRVGDTLQIKYTWTLDAVLDFVPDWMPMLSSGATGSTNIGYQSSYPHGVTTVEVGKKYEITYTNLSPGTQYFFAVTGRNKNATTQSSDFINFAISNSREGSFSSAPRSFRWETNGSGSSDIFWEAPSSSISEINSYGVMIGGLRNGDGFNGIDPSLRTYDVHEFPPNNYPTFYALAAIDGYGNYGDWAITAANWPALRNAPEVWISNKTETSITYSWTLDFTPSVPVSWSLNFLGPDYWGYRDANVSKAGSVYSVTFSDLTPGEVYSFAVAPYSTANTSDTSVWTNFGVVQPTATTSQVASTAINLTASVGEKLADSLVLTDGLGLERGSDWELELASTPTIVGSGRVDFGGNFASSVQLPSTIAAGQHHLTLRARDANGVSKTTIIEVRLATDGTILSIGSEEVGTLAATGLSTWPILYGSAALFVVGLAVLLTFRRKLQAKSPTKD